eukprot:g1318.t1
MSEAGPKGGRGGLGISGSRRGQPYNFAGAKAYGESEIQTAAPLPAHMTQHSKPSGSFRSNEPAGRLNMVRFNLVKFVREGEGPDALPGMQPTLNKRTRLASSDDSDDSDDSSDSSDSSDSDSSGSSSGEESDDEVQRGNADALRVQSAKAAEEARKAALAWKPKANLAPPKKRKKRKKEGQNEKRGGKKARKDGHGEGSPVHVWKWKMEIKTIVKNYQGDSLTVRAVTKNVIKQFKSFCATPAGVSLAAVAALSKSELKSFVKKKIASASFLQVSDDGIVQMKKTSTTVAQRATKLGNKKYTKNKKHKKAKKDKKAKKAKKDKKGKKD